MRLLQRLPLLPNNEGSLWTTETHGENSTGLLGRRDACNVLSKAALKPTVPGESISYSDFDFFSLLMSSNTELIFVDYDPPRGQEWKGLVGFSLARLQMINRHCSRTTIDRLAVHPDFRKRQIASYMLSRTLDITRPDELVVDTTKLKTQKWFKDRLRTAGFNHYLENGSPAMWTPGANVVEINTEETDLAQFFSTMPNDWYGTVNIHGNTENFDNRAEVYRASKKVGGIRLTSNPTDSDATLGSTIASYSLFDAQDTCIGALAAVTEREALIDLLNMHNLVSPDMA